MRGREGRPSLWAFDFDGTLSPIVPVRTEARLHPACRSLLGDLARLPGNRVAVLSSRSLDDLIPRVPVRRVFLGGGSGLEWRLPGGQRVRPGAERERIMEKARKALSPILAKIGDVPGVDIEDKRWSIAIHHRRVPADAAPALAPLLRKVRQSGEVRVFDGPAVAEVQLLPGWEKALGLERLGRILRIDPSGAGVVYAGDDENDGTAMRWAIRRKGIAFSVGTKAKVPGARVVAGPLSLARSIRRLAWPPGEDLPGKGRGAAA